MHVTLVRPLGHMHPQSDVLKVPPFKQLVVFKGQTENKSSICNYCIRDKVQFVSFGTIIDCLKYFTIGNETKGRYQY